MPIKNFQSSLEACIKKLNFFLFLMSTHQKSLKNNKKNIFSMKTLVENTNKCS